MERIVEVLHAVEGGCIGGWFESTPSGRPEAVDEVLEGRGCSRRLSLMYGETGGRGKKNFFGILFLLPVFPVELLTARSDGVDGRLGRATRPRIGSLDSGRVAADERPIRESLAPSVLVLVFYMRW